MEENFATINDPVWGTIRVPSFFMHIIDTAEFQRLRRIKQLTFLECVYPGAVHTRFEHSIGTCHLAGEMLTKLLACLPEDHPEITVKDRMCVQLAALCHDLGHACFSHFYDGIFLPHVSPQGNWTHEEGSYKLFDYLLENNPKASSTLDELGFREDDFTFIKEMIFGPLKPVENISWSTVTSINWPYKGRDSSKSILYQIVSNKWCGIDVDKFDYFHRDAYYCGLQNLVLFNLERYYCCLSVRMNKETNLWTIVHRLKDFDNVRNIFITRAALHTHAYQHRISKVAELMFCYALKEADQYLSLPGENGETFTPSKCTASLPAYVRLTDDIFSMIYNFELLSLPPEAKPAMEKARKILQQIEKRNFFKLVGRTVLISELQSFNHGISTELAEKIIKCNNGCKGSLTVEDIIVYVTIINYGQKNENPLRHVRFFEKNSAELITKESDDCIYAPSLGKLASQTVRLYMAGFDKEDKVSVAEECFIEWCKREGLQNMTKSEAETPAKDLTLERRQKRDFTPPRVH